MAHKNIHQVCKLIEYFHTDCYVFIHWDKKHKLTKTELSQLMKYPQVKFCSQEYDVHWGGTSVLECEIQLLRIAIKHSDADYFHLISGQDYPTRPLSQFLDFFEKNTGKNFIQYVHLPHPNWDNNTFRRFQYYYPYDYVRGKDAKQWVNKQVKSQYEKGIKRPIPDEFEHLYGSSQWFSINRKAAITLVDYTDKSPAFYKRLWMTFAPEECYVATVLINLLGKDDIISDNLRFIRWKYENGNRPANLGNEHFSYLLEKEYLFARKIELPCSEHFLKLVDKYLIRDKAEIEQTATGSWIYDGFLKYEYDNSFSNFVIQLYYDMGVKTALDMGCGNGNYVAQWRSIGLSFAGYDANPYTESLSKILLPDNDTPCGSADITEEDLFIPTPFDLVVCKDVLPYIPDKKEHIAIKNLARLSSHAILLSWKVSNNYSSLSYRDITEKELILSFETEGFILEKYLTAKLRKVLKRIDCCLLIKRNAEIIIN